MRKEKEKNSLKMNTRKIQGWVWHSFPWLRINWNPVDWTVCAAGICVFPVHVLRLTMMTANYGDF